MSEYIIVNGDTLSEIALKYDTTVGALMALNNITNPNLIYTGSVMKVPSDESQSSVKYKISEPTDGYYTSDDAKNKVSKVSTVMAGSYYVYNEYNGMVNVTTQVGVPGTWINPTVDTSSVKGDAVVPATGGVPASPTYADKAIAWAVDGIECYVKNMITGSTVSFYLPEEFNDEFSAQFDDAEVRGRTSPMRGYSGSGPRQLNFTATIHADYCVGGLMTTIDKLKALTFPKYGSNIEPPSCYIRIGNIVSAKTTVNSIGIAYQKPYRNGEFVMAEVSFDMTEVVDESYDAVDIENGLGRTSNR